jgi:hypothetical protein
LPLEIHIFVPLITSIVHIFGVCACVSVFVSVCVSVGVASDDDEVCKLAVGDPHLRAVDHVYSARLCVFVSVCVGFCRDDAD